LVEALGSETYVSAHLTSDENINLTISLPPSQQIAINDSIWLAVDINNIHLFSVDSGQAIVIK